MAAAVHKLLHPHRSREQHREEEHERHNSATERARDEEKHTLAQWGEKKAPLEPGQIDKDPDQKMVGHSSSVLRKEDFELIKTLGTGEWSATPHAARRETLTGDRHLCARLAGERQECAERRREPGLCAQDPAEA
jgi:protein kinase A